MRGDCAPVLAAVLRIAPCIATPHQNAGCSHRLITGGVLFFRDDDLYMALIAPKTNGKVGDTFTRCTCMNIYDQVDTQVYTHTVYVDAQPEVSRRHAKWNARLDLSVHPGRPLGVIYWRVHQPRTARTDPGAARSFRRPALM
jgi:hypothetical protein